MYIFDKKISLLSPILVKKIKKKDKRKKRKKKSSEPTHSTTNERKKKKKKKTSRGKRKISKTYHTLCISLTMTPAYKSKK
jgi:hypothetical protein